MHVAATETDHARAYPLPAATAAIGAAWLGEGRVRIEPQSPPIRVSSTCMTKASSTGEWLLACVRVHA